MAELFTAAGIGYWEMDSVTLNRIDGRLSEVSAVTIDEEEICVH